MSEYNDEDRRTSGKDHDLLVEVHAMLRNMKENYQQHVQDDEKHFGRLYSSTSKLKWYIGVGAGAIAALELFKDKIFGR